MRKRLTVIITFLLLFTLLSPALAAPDVTQTQVIRTVDGDTLVIKLNGKQERVRMIGVDTPETHHPSKPVQYYGKEAEAFTRSQLTGATVYLEFDAQQRDKYGRLLAYVWTSRPDSESDARDKMFNAKLLLDGYAKLLTVPPNVKYVDQFKDFQRESRENNRGLWGK